MLMLYSISIYFVVRYGVAMLFLAYSTHRGNCHSLAAMLFAGVVTAMAAYQLTGDAVLSWSYGCAVMIGVLIHLVLDEVYAVDFAGVRLKKSFGSAIKMLSMDAPIAGLALVVATLFLLFTFAPPLSDAVALYRFLRAQVPI